MSIARLDNEVFFKKVFTDPFVFRAFVKDIVGIEVDPEKIETEKSFSPKLGNVDFRYDIFAEDAKRRVIVEIQKVEYDHNFDRFMHYHLQGIVEQQRSSDDYSVGRTVYTIVVITAPYRSNTKTGEVYRDEVLISSINPKNLHGIERKMFNHELVFLNPNYRGPDTPGNYRDWLDLIYESIHSPENPRINSENEGVQRAAGIIEYDNISPREWEESKIEVSKRKVLEIQREEGRMEGLEEGIEKGIEKGIEVGLAKGKAQGELNAKMEIARKLKALGMDVPSIMDSTGLDSATISAI